MTRVEQGGGRGALRLLMLGLLEARQPRRRGRADSRASPRAGGGRSVWREQQPDAPRLLSMPSAGPRAAPGVQNEIPLLRVLAAAARGAGAPSGGFLGRRFERVCQKPGLDQTN